jgi:protein-tyrosine-phosphatase
VRDLPGSVLFACTSNIIRSPMAEAYLKYLHGNRIYVDSVGVRAGAETDGFAIAVMEEIGIDISKHRPKDFDRLEDASFDIVISLSPEAHHRAIEMTRTMAIEAEFWRTLDPSVVEGSRETRLAAYRELRNAIIAHILERFPPAPKPI